MARVRSVPVAGPMPMALRGWGIALCALALASVAPEQTAAVDSGCECIDRKGEDDGQIHDKDLCPGTQITSTARIPSTEECCEYCRKHAPQGENWVMSSRPKPPSWLQESPATRRALTGRRAPA